MSHSIERQSDGTYKLYKDYKLVGTLTFDEALVARDSIACLAKTMNDGRTAETVTWAIRVLKVAGLWPNHVQGLAEPDEL